jgi:hypothetical protein
MPYQGSLPSYDVPIGPTRADLGKHKCAGRAWFGLGPLRCECGERWGEFGCPERVATLFTYLQVSTESARTEDLTHKSDLFTTFEAEIIAENDRRRRGFREAAEEERRKHVEKSDEFAAIWQASYPEPAKPAYWFGPSQTGVHEVIREPVAAVPRQRAPEARMPFQDPIDLGALTA